MPATHMNANEQLVRERAYHIWEQAGRPFGQADLHWRMAKELVDMAQAAIDAAPPSKSRSGRKAAALDGTPAPAKTGRSRKAPQGRVAEVRPVYQ